MPFSPIDQYNTLLSSFFVPVGLARADTGIANLNSSFLRLRALENILRANITTIRDRVATVLTACSDPAGSSFTVLCDEITNARDNLELGIDFSNVSERGNGEQKKWRKNAAHSTWHTIRGIQYVAYNTWHTVRGTQYAAYNTWGLECAKKNSEILMIFCVLSPSAGSVKCPCRSGEAYQSQCGRANPWGGYCVWGTRLCYSIAMGKWIFCVTMSQIKFIFQHEFRIKFQFWIWTNSCLIWKTLNFSIIFFVFCVYSCVWNTLTNRTILLNEKIASKKIDNEWMNSGNKTEEIEHWKGIVLLMDRNEKELIPNRKAMNEKKCWEKMLARKLNQDQTAKKHSIKKESRMRTEQ